MGSTPPLGDMRSWSLLEPGEALAEFEEMRDAQPGWAEKFIAWCAGRDMLVERLDFSVESLDPAWEWFSELAVPEPVGFVYPDPAGREYAELLDVPRWMRMRYPKILENGVDWFWAATWLSGYLAEVVCRAAPSAYWKQQADERVGDYQWPQLNLGAHDFTPINVVVNFSGRGAELSLREKFERWIAQAKTNPSGSASPGSVVDSEPVVEVEVDGGSDLVSVSFSDEIAHGYEDWVSQIEETLPKKFPGLSIVDGDREVLWMRDSSQSQASLKAGLDKYLSGLGDPRS